MFTEAWQSVRIEVVEFIEAKEGVVVTRQKAHFVGQWAPTFLILGLYNKMVKLHGSDGEKNSVTLS